MEQGTPTWQKVLGVLGALALIGLLALVALGFWAKNAAEEFLVNVETDLPAMAEEGVQYAATHTAAECLEEGRNRAVPCGALELTCQLSATLFGQSCLDAANPDPAVCTDVPVDSALSLGTWAQDRCTAEGYPDSTPCVSYYQQVLVAHCRIQADGD